MQILNLSLKKAGNSGIIHEDLNLRRIMSAKSKSTPVNNLKQIEMQP